MALEDWVVKNFEELVTSGAKTWPDVLATAEAQGVKDLAAFAQSKIGPVVAPVVDAVAAKVEAVVDSPVGKAATPAVEAIVEPLVEEIVAAVEKAEGK